MSGATPRPLVDALVAVGKAEQWGQVPDGTLRTLKEAHDDLVAALRALVEDHDARDHYVRPMERMRDWPCQVPVFQKARALLRDLDASGGQP